MSKKKQQSKDIPYTPEIQEILYDASEMAHAAGLTAEQVLREALDRVRDRLPKPEECKPKVRGRTYLNTRLADAMLRAWIAADIANEGRVIPAKELYAELVKLPVEVPITEESSVMVGVPKSFESFQLIMRKAVKRLGLTWLIESHRMAGQMIYRIVRVEHEESHPLFVDALATVRRQLRPDTTSDEDLRRQILKWAEKNPGRGVIAAELAAELGIEISSRSLGTWLVRHTEELRKLMDVHVEFASGLRRRYSFAPADKGWPGEEAN